MRFRITTTDGRPNDLPERNYETEIDERDRVHRYLEISTLEELLQFTRESEGGEGRIILGKVRRDYLDQSEPTENDWLIEVYNDYRE